MASIKSHIVCILDKTSPSKIFQSMISSNTFYDKHYITKVSFPSNLSDWIEAGPHFKIEYYIISTNYYKIESFKRKLATIKDKHIIWIV